MYKTTKQCYTVKLNPAAKQKSAFTIAVHNIIPFLSVILIVLLFLYTQTDLIDKEKFGDS